MIDTCCKVDLRTVSLDVPPLTKDSVTVNAVVYPLKVYGVVVLKIYVTDWFRDKCFLNGSQ